MDDLDLSGQPLRHPNGDLEIRVQAMEITTQWNLDHGQPAQFAPGLKTCYIGGQVVSRARYVQEFIRRYGHPPIDSDSQLR